MEEEAHSLLCAALAHEPAGGSLVESIRSRFEQLGGVELEIAPREPIRQPPDPGP